MRRSRQRISKVRTPKVIRTAGIVTAVIFFTILTWVPRIIHIRTLTIGDLISDRVIQEIYCGGGPITGWPINDGSIGTALGAYAPTLPSYLIARTSCFLGKLLHISGQQSFVIIGIILTVVISYSASMASGLGTRAALLIGYGLATAPSAFSRFVHLQLSQLWPVMPCIAVCALLLARERYPANRQGSLYSHSLLGLAMGIGSFTAQEYYAVFSILCVTTCYAAGLALSTKELNRPSVASAGTQKNQAHRKEKRYHYFIIAAGYTAVMMLYLASKQLLWRIPEWAHSATHRAAIEQFTYNFWPSNILTSPLFNQQLMEIFKAKNQLPVNETPFGSSSGIAVVIALAISLVCWMKSRRNGNGELERQDAMILAFGGVLIVTISIACVVATAGGLGTLFAVFISPQLRALNRITPYFYCAALTICSIKLDQIISEILCRKKTRANV